MRLRFVNHVYMEIIYIFKLTLGMLGNFSCLLTFKSSRNSFRVSNSMDPDQDRHSVGPDLGPNCLQRLSAE